MSWEDKIRAAVYTSPSGVEFTFQYEGLEKETVKKTTAFEFPDVDGTYIQDLGRSGRRYPMRVIFWGDNYDIVAKAFDTAIEERGPGHLQHPFYGDFDVVPFGSIRRRDDLVNAANQVIYDITFWETIDIVFPVSDVNALNSIDDGLAAYAALQAANFNESVSASTSSELVAFVDSVKAGARKVKRAMTGIARTTESINRAFNDLFDAIEDGADALVGTPILLATQLIELTRLPARASADVSAKLAAYTNLIESFTVGSSNEFVSGNDSQSGNAYSTSALLASAAVAASVESTVTITNDSAFGVVSQSLPSYTTRSSVISSIEDLTSNFDAFVDWSDTNRELLVQGAQPTRIPGTNDLIDTGEGYQQLLDIYSLANGRLIQIVFSSLQEREIKLTEATSLLNFAAEFYGQVDPVLDFIIESNNLTGSEIIELPKGRSMVYYV